ncbi:MAG TPA: divergent polysaccharide deacetylase family protein [Acetomicrobium flavidum]|uniref:divergent polysaccharide deacetylase family protein n=1 Tax=Acetomicrobium flavidum TaxID=49896 RepID=UPI002C2293B2|nr:divergent polysaccharide deacetylase family protein [Acetomicrobium flavidum]
MKTSDKFKWAVIAFILGLGLALIFCALRRDALLERSLQSAAVSASTSASDPSNQSGERSGGTKTADKLQDEPTSNGNKDALLAGPFIAIVVDDLGFSYARAEELSRINLPLTWAIIPFQSASEKTARLATQKGIPFLVHIPMQAFSDKDGKGYMVATSMRDEEIKENVRKAFRSLPGAIGANNHRGSAATSDMRVMRAAMEGLKEEAQRGNFKVFVDSRTASSSVAAAEAKKAGLLALENGAFVDHLEDVKFMRSQLERAARQAQKNGYAVVICHARPKTLVFLKELSQNPVVGVKFVTVEELVRHLRGERNHEGHS